MTRSFLQLSLEGTTQDVERLEDACFEAGALSVTLSDAANDPILEPLPDTTPLWPRVRISALFSDTADQRAIVASLTATLGHPPRDPHFINVADRVWEREWLADFKPMRFGRRLWVSPHEQHVDEADAVVVQLDPGLAFGTGTHPTTALCLEWLDSARLSGRTVIDYGCGSGILAIAALKLGAERALAVDHDPQALLATRENAERNAVSDRIETLEPGSALPRAHILLANILALPLIGLAPQFETVIAAGGDVVLSGILRTQADEVAAAYAPWLEIEPAVQRDGWVRLHGRRRN